jgi:hypothetical protein
MPEALARWEDQRMGTAPAPDIRVVDVPDGLRFDIRVDGRSPASPITAAVRG